MSGGGRSSSAVDTVHAAASVIAAGDNRSPHAAGDNRSPHATTVQKRRWGSFWNLSGCAVSWKHRSRIVDAVLVPDPVAPRVDASAAETVIQAPSIVFPFVAPPSSPVSFLHSEPSSVTLSPASGPSLNAMSESMYSLGGPASIFAVGPYAHETRFVSPPVPSTYSTEPSTAPFTPPPESIHLITPSSPEVPFARMLEPINQNGESGTLSPVTDGEFHPECHNFIDIRTVESSKLVCLENTMPHEWGLWEGSGSMTPDAVESADCHDLVQDYEKLNVPPRSNSGNLRRTDGEVGDHRLSFEITAEEVMRCVEKKPVAMPKAVLLSLMNGLSIVINKDSSMQITNGQTCCAFETLRTASGRISRDWDDALWHQKQQSTTPLSVKEFNFDRVDGGTSSPNVGSNWWANEKVLEKEGGAAGVSFPRCSLESANWSYCNGKCAHQA